MHYEEKIIDGIMYYRTSAEYAFKPYDMVELTAQYVYQKRRANNFEAQLLGIARNIMNQFSSLKNE